MTNKQTKIWLAVHFGWTIAFCGAAANTFAQAPPYGAVYPNSPVINTQTTYGYPSFGQVSADPFSAQRPPVAAVYPNGAYQVAQLPPQAPPPFQPFPGQPQPGLVPPPPGFTGQPQPGFVPQNYAAPPPTQQPYWNPVNPYQPGGFNTGRPPVWSVHAAWIYMTRTKSNGFPLLLDVGGGTLVDAENLNYGWKSGFDAGISRRNQNGSNFELRYFQIDSWSANLSSTYDPTDAIATNLPSMLSASGSVSPGTASYLADSSLYSFEANFVDRQLGGERFRLAIGFRWMEVSENLAQTFAGAEATDLTFETDTNNHLYGLQFGSDGTLYSNGRFNIVGWGKSGVYGNVADQSTIVTRDIVLRANGARGTNVAYVGESGLIGEWRLTPAVSIVGGYQLIYISGVSLAADQLPNMTSISDGLDPVRLDQSGVFYHGAYVGIDVHW